MKVVYVHASKFGNGVRVAQAFKRGMVDRGITVEVHHIKELGPKELPRADLYLFSSPGRFGKPIRGMRRFLKDIELPAGTRYALLTTEMSPQPDKETGRMPTDEELGRYQRVRPIMNELLQGKGLVEVAEISVFVTGLKGPLEAGWQEKVEAFVQRLADGALRSSLPDVAATRTASR